MKIVLNSDILRDEQLVTSRLPKRLQKLIYTCAERKHIVAIPLTALLEFRRHQSELVTKNILALESAYALLEKFQVPYTRTEPSEIVKLPDLAQLIRDIGVEVTIEEPTLDDFNEAHRRACLHEYPHPEETESDEMRDLVIWMIALRLAKQEEGALLVSRDIVHTNPRGDDEAAAVHLTRVKSVEEALEYFDVETPAGKLVKQLLEPVWDDLINAGLPVAKPMSLMSVAECRFVQGTLGPSFGHCVIKARTGRGEKVQATVDILVDDSTITSVNLSGILVEGKPFEYAQISITPNRSINIQDDYTERLDALKSVLSGG